MAAAFTPQSLSTSSLLPQSTPSTTPKPTILQPFQQQAAFAYFQGLRSSSSSSSSSAAARAKKVGLTPCPTSKGEPPRGVILCSANRMNLVFVSAEVAPWSKTGGLGDVISGLPSALAARGHRVMTVAPRYDQYIDGWDTSVVIQVKVGDKMEEVRFFHCFKDGVDRVFVDHPLFLAKVLGKTGVKIYGAEFGEDYEDNKLRFSLLSQAALEAPRVLNLSNNPYFSGPYGEDVMFIANDWHSALLPCYLQAFYKPFGLYKNAKVAYCIHNVAYQGLFPFTEFPLLNLPGKFKSSFDFMEWRNEPVGRKINWMKAGILESDMVLTVSPNYACELLSEPDRGAGLNTIVRKTGITGIVNGMDVQEWDPSTDKYLEVKYDISTVFEAKPAMKEALQAEVGLPVDSRIPVFAFIGRLDEQKGSDILVEALPEILEQNIQLILLGTGKKYLEKQLAELEIKYPKKARGVPNFSARFGHILTAGADFMLIPSRFEPCGLIQLHAMRYGTVPVVASTGGLVDTVKDGVTGFHLGRAFTTVGKGMDSSDVKSLAAVVKRALGIYGTSQFDRMVKTCMDQDFSWKRPAKIWENALLDLQNRPEAEEEEPTPFVLEKVAIS